MSANTATQPTHAKFSVAQGTPDIRVSLFEQRPLPACLFICHSYPTTSFVQPHSKRIKPDKYNDLTFVSCISPSSVVFSGIYLPVLLYVRTTPGWGSIRLKARREDGVCHRINKKKETGKSEKESWHRHLLSNLILESWRGEQLFYRLRLSLLRLKLRLHRDCTRGMDSRREIYLSTTPRVLRWV